MGLGLNGECLIGQHHCPEQQIFGVHCSVPRARPPQGATCPQSVFWTQRIALDSGLRPRRLEPNSNLVTRKAPSLTSPRTKLELRRQKKPPERIGRNHHLLQRQKFKLGFKVNSKWWTRSSRAATMMMRSNMISMPLTSKTSNTWMSDN